MYLIVGLGNPGEEYEHTRHNAGFGVIGALADELGINYWKSECGAKTGHTTHRGQEIVLAMPQSYMNTSGGPVKQLCRAYGIDAEHLIVASDDLDLEAGSIRVKRGGGSAGHNGLKSIIAKLGTKEFYRVRCGIGRPPGRMPVADFVLANLRKKDLQAQEEMCAEAARACLSIIDVGLETTQQQFN